MEIVSSIKPNWIYDFSDYQQMYDLSESDLSKKIIDVSAGMASFNAEAKQRDIHVVSVDATYTLSDNDMQHYAKQFLQEMTTQLNQHRERLRDPSDAMEKQVSALWKKTETLFLQDYHEGKIQKRYQPLLLPKTPFALHQFDIALCTDFIFHHLLSFDDIVSIVTELCRVATEVRIFPLQDNAGRISDELGPLMLMLQKRNCGVEVREVPFKTLKGSNAMLRIWEQECHL